MVFMEPARLIVDESDGHSAETYWSFWTQQVYQFSKASPSKAERQTRLCQHVAGKVLRAIARVKSAGPVPPHFHYSRTRDTLV
jgi:hypothetical protein